MVHHQASADRHQGVLTIAEVTLGIGKYVSGVGDVSCDFHQSTRRSDTEKLIGVDTFFETP